MLELLKKYTDRLPTLTQLPTGKDDEHERNIRRRQT